jgi:hypothetical protein
MSNLGQIPASRCHAPPTDRHISCVLSLFLLFLIFPVYPAAAEKDITLSLGIEQQQSSNFYRSEEDEISVYSTIIKPGIIARTWTDRSSLFFAYSPVFNYYSDDSNRLDASDDNFVGHDLSLMGETTFFERLKLSLTERFYDTREPGAYDVFLESEADRERYKSNQVSPFLTYDFAEKFTAVLGYQYQAYNFEDSDNSQGHRGYVTLRYHFDDRNSLEVEEQYWTRRYPTNPDYKSSQIKLIFRRELSDFLKCEIGGGFHDRRFESGAAGVEDYDGFIYRLGLTGESDVSKLFLGYSKNLNDFSKGNWYFEAQRITLNLERTFLEKLTCILAAYYQENDYEVIIPGTTERREDDIWDALVGIRYRIRDWLSAGVSYQYTDRDSNITGWSYSENRVYGNITLEYGTVRRQ